MKERRMMLKPEQHLYLIFDDWELGYAVHKVDLFSDHDPVLTPHNDPWVAASCLPPPIFIFTALHYFPRAFSAIGSKILAPHPLNGSDDLDLGCACFDVHNRSLNFIPRLTKTVGSMYIPIGNMILTLGIGSFELLDFLPLDSDTPNGQLDAQLDAPLCGTGGQLNTLRHFKADAPLDSYSAVAYAILPDNQTIFLSTGSLDPEATYSFHMSEDGSSHQWKHHGNWRLPFLGRGYFVSELNTWIGLSVYSEKLGHICSCELASMTSMHRPNLKYNKEYLFTEASDQIHVASTLVYMGDGTKFCLVESILINSVALPHYTDAHCDYMLRLTTFSLEYDQHGDLTTGGSRQVRYYKIPKQASEYSCELPEAFWI